jgi:hypothetical protein
MLEQLKNFAANRMAIDELVALRAYGRIVEAEYEAQKVEAPEWVAENLKALDREIKSKNADRLAARLRDVRARLEASKSPTEKRAALKREEAKLEKLLQSA